MGVLDRVSYQECCGCCRYYEPHPDPSAGVGQCRRHSPQLVRETSAWPLVAEVQWCGDWEPTADA